MSAQSVVPLTNIIMLFIWLQACGSVQTSISSLMRLVTIVCLNCFLRLWKTSFVIGLYIIDVTDLPYDRDIKIKCLKQMKGHHAVDLKLQWPKAVSFNKQKADIIKASLLNDCNPFECITDEKDKTS